MQSVKSSTSRLATRLILREYSILMTYLAQLSLLIAALVCGGQAVAQHAQKNDPGTYAMQTEILKAFAPTGVLRASLNVGNPVLANLDKEGKPFGISIDLALELGKRLGVPVELIVNETAGKSVATVESGRADIGFFAVDPERGKEIAFTHAYVLIEGYYLVRDESPITNNAQVDTPANRIVVGKGSAYDLFLTRHIKQAQIERAPSSQAVVSTFLKDGFEVAAGVKQQLQADTRDVQGVRMLEERFMVIRQAMGVPKDRGPQAALYLRTFVEEMKARGLIKESMTKHGIQGAGVAPAADPSTDPLNVQ